MIDLWTLHLDVPLHTRETLFAELSDTERARAKRFVFERDRTRFIAGRGYLRRILSDYLGVAAVDVRIEESSRGKPGVADAGAPLHFNLSHSGAVAALGVSRTHDIGVDIELVRPITEGLAERFFSGAENTALAALPEHERLAGFFRCWTRKEAFVKASGEGIQRGLDTFTVDIADTPRTRLLALDDDPQGQSKWSFLNFTLDDDVIGSVAVPSADENLQLRRRTLD
jgi:4'-phosphopantetheinyl transferase